jgi:NADPH:quinone reductase-like Zn-dependent oxidoreductase
VRTRAILINKLGPPEALEEREVPLRDLGPDDVHLAVHAAGVNFADLMMRVGLYGTVPPRPFSPGFEVAGIVERVGPGVEGVSPGDRAVALVRYGGYARDLIVPMRNLFPCPPELSFAQAAAVPVVFLTGHVALFEAARVRRGESLLVLGAGGGVGTAAVQLAVRAGLRVVGTAGSEAKRALVKGLGAEACFDTHGDWAAEVEGLFGRRGLDAALDPVGGEATAQCRRLLAPLGRLVFYGLSEAMPGRRRDWLAAASAWLRTPRFHPLSLVEPNLGIFGIHLLHLRNREDVLRGALSGIFARIVAGELKPVLDRSFPLTAAGAAEAHRYLHERRNVGKVVLVAGERHGPRARA